METGEIKTVRRITKWIFDVAPKRKPSKYQLNYGRVKVFLLENLHRSVTRHDLQECFQLLKLLPREVMLDPYALLRLVFILLECNDSKSVNKNVIIYLESLFSKLDLCKPDVFVEFLSYFIRHNRIDDAAELYDQRHRHMSGRIHRQVPFIIMNMNCYGFLLKYLKWAENVENNISKSTGCDKSVQGWLVNAIDCLRATTSNHEYFVMCVVRVLLHNAYYNKAYLFVHEFQSNNRENIGAQLLFLNLIQRLELMAMQIKEEPSSQPTPIDLDLNDEEKIKNRKEDLANINNFAPDMATELFNPDKYPILSDKRNVMRNLRRLDSSSNELMKMRDLHDNHIDVLRDLMDGMEVLHQVRNKTRWLNLKQTLQEIFNTNDEVLVTDARFLWHTRYKRFWKPIDFVALAGNHVSSKDRKLIREVIDLLKSKLDRPIR